MRVTSLFLTLSLISPFAGASLITSATSVQAPSSTIDFSQFGGFESGGNGYQGTGPLQIGALVGEDVQWSSSTSEAVVYSGLGRYGLGGSTGNGHWDETRQGFSGLNAPEPNWMSYEFASPVAAVGGFVNYFTGDNPSAVIIEALAADGTILESHDLLTEAPISTPGQINAGEFRGIARSSAQIKALRVWNGWMVLDDLTFNRTPTPSFVFDITEQSDPAERRVLISRDPNDQGGYHRFQRLISQDRRVPMNVRAYDSQGNPLAAGTLVHFRVADPPSGAPYEPQRTPYLGDNVDHTGGALSGPTIVPIATTAPLVSQGTVGTAGLVEMVLTVTDHAAGDNYAVEASLDPAFACSPNCVRSGIVTAWKRIYLERKRMFRKGSFITSAATEVDWKQQDGTLLRVTQVTVQDRSRFAVNDRVMLIHGAPKNGGSTSFYFDEATVLGLPRRTNDIVLDKVITRPFGPDPVDTTTARFGDAIGVVTGNVAADYYEADARYASDAFAQAYVEVEDAAQAFSAFPYFTPDYFVGDFEPVARKWFENASHNTALPQALPNHVFVVGASQTLRDGQNDIASCTYTQDEGKTARYAGTNVSAIFVQRIEQLVATHFLGNCGSGRKLVSPLYGLSATLASGEVTVHEVAHQFRVNASNSDGHCGYRDADGRITGGFLAYDSPASAPLYCLMTPVTARKEQSSDGVLHFHFLSNNDSEYMTIRSKDDPLPW